MTKPTAIGQYIFAGGFTLGVKKHFRVHCVNEAGPYGVATARHNQPEIPIHVGLENWKAVFPTDFVYGNPPCAAWSPAGAKLTPGTRDWRKDDRVDCTRQHFRHGLQIMKPKVWAWESVPQAFTAGREFVDHLTELAHEEGYSVTYLLHNAMYLGCAQNRRRFFFVAHNVEFEVDVPRWETLSCGEVIRGLNDVGELSPAAAKLDRYDDILPLVNQGETLRAAWDRHTTKIIRKPNGMIKGRPAFTIKRPRHDSPSGVVMNEMVHPTEHRFMTMKELQILCGFPRDYEFIADGDMGQISRGVCPPVGEWLARNVARAIRLNVPVKKPYARVIDVSKPPGAREMIDIGHIKEDLMLKIPKSSTTRHAYQPPAEGEGSGAFIRRMLQAGEMTPDQIVETVHEYYPGSKATKADVAWNRNRLRKMNGGDNTDPRRGRQRARPGGHDTRRGAEVLAEVRDRSAPQPTRSRRTNVDVTREFDTTALKRGGSNERGVHRDYAAHYFRWGFAGRFSNNATRILDVGCGTDLPLVAILNHPRNLVPKAYTGVDYNKEPTKVPHRQWAEYHWQFDFTRDFKKLKGPYDLVTCFEVIEHMREKEGRLLLDGIRWNLAPDGVALLSTPVFDGKAAANHLKEWENQELHDAIVDAGLTIERKFGTFMNYQAVKKVATREELRIAESLKEYYSGEVIACFLAPLYPDASRNIVWKLRRNGKSRRG